MLKNHLVFIVLLTIAVVAVTAQWSHDNTQKQRWHDAYEQTHARFEKHMSAMNDEGCHVRKFVPLPRIGD